MKMKMEIMEIKMMQMKMMQMQRNTTFRTMNVHVYSFVVAWTGLLLCTALRSHPYSYLHFDSYLHLFFNRFTRRKGIAAR